MVSLFHSEIKHLPKYDKPSLIVFTTIQPGDIENLLNTILQEKYRSLVGTILYLTKIKRTYLRNIIR